MSSIVLGVKGVSVLHFESTDKGVEFISESTPEDARNRAASSSTISVAIGITTFSHVKHAPMTTRVSYDFCFGLSFAFGEFEV